MWRAAVLIVGLAVAGCAHQVAPVSPGDSVYYRFTGHAWARDPGPTWKEIKEHGDVLVGVPFVIDAEFAATCRYSTKPLGRDDNLDRWPDEYGACKAEPTEVAISCRGACAVDRIKYVTPTAPGPLVVDVDLTSRKTGRRARLTHTLQAVAPDGFHLSCREGWVEHGRCSTGTQEIRAWVRLGQHLFDAPIELQVNGHRVAATAGGVLISLPEVLGTPPGSPGRLPAGAYPVELAYGDLREVFTVVIQPSA